jgi:hypothetical protein
MVIKSRRQKWALHVERMGRTKICTVIWRGNLKERDHLEDLGLDGRIILKWVLNRMVVGNGLDATGSRWKQVTGCYKHNDALSGSIKFRELLI